MRSDGGGPRRRHLSPGTRAALARTRLIEVVPAGPSRLHSSAPPRSDEPPVVLHPLWAPVHPRRADRTDTRGPLHRAHVLHPSVPPRRGPRPGRRPRPVVPFDIPVEAFAVEVGGGAHPSVRSLGERRLVYIEHRHAMRRAYRRRQLFLAVGLSGAFVAVSAAALAPSGHAAAAVAGAAGRGPAQATASAGADGSAARPVGFALLRRRRSAPEQASETSVPFALEAGFSLATRRESEDRDERRIAFEDSVTSGSLANDPFLVCTRGFESIYAGGYRAVSPSGRYRGAYQFDQMTWDGIATHLKLFSLVGMSPDAAPPGVQDLLAYKLYKWQGAGHWHHRCAGLP